MKDYYTKEINKHKNSKKLSVKGIQQIERRKKKGEIVGEEKRKNKTTYKSNMKIGKREILGFIILIAMLFAYIAFKETDGKTTEIEATNSSLTKKPEVIKEEIVVIKECVEKFISHSKQQGFHPNKAEIKIINESCED